MTETTPNLRTEPAQRRAHERVDSILDAAAQLADAHGVGAVTTTGVAVRADVSVGGLYRYFPDVDAIFAALAARNAERFWRLVAARDLGQSGRAFLEHVMGTYVEFARSEPGFREVHFGDIAAASTNIGDALLTTMATRGGLAMSPELILDVQIAVTMSAALMRLAFTDDPQGDRAIIDRTIAMVSLLFARHLRDTVA